MGLVGMTVAPYAADWSASQDQSATAGPDHMDLLVTLDPAGRVPLHTQLERALRDDVRGGRLRPGARLPSTRRLAGQLGVSRGVVVEAYAQLTAEGYLATDRGSGTRVAHARRRRPPPAPRTRRAGGRATRSTPASRTCRPFPAPPGSRRPGARCRRCPTRTSATDPSAARALREALAEHLGRTRGTAADPQRMLVCSGLIQGFALAFAALRAAGAQRIALEDPGWLGHRTVAAHAGLEAVPIPR